MRVFSNKAILTCARFRCLMVWRFGMDSDLFFVHRKVQVKKSCRSSQQCYSSMQGRCDCGTFMGGVN